MAKLTKAEQDKLVEELDCFLNPIYLQCDGYLIQAHLTRVKHNKLEIIVYVNGCIRGEWFCHDPSPEAIRFYRPTARSVYSKKQIAGLEKIYGKREAKKQDIYRKTTYYLCTWLRPGPFVRHLIKHNESIRVLDYQEYKKLLAEVKDNG